MKLHILSDLHMDADHWLPPSTASDVLIVAGDLYDDAGRSIDWCAEARRRSGRPVVFVAGNHEFYGRCLQEGIEQMRSHARESGVHFLHNESVVIDGVRFVGAILWTDFCADGPGFRTIATHAAREFFADYKHIRYRDQSGERPLTPEDTILEHEAALVAIQEGLADAYTEKVVVITHHAPLKQSLDPAYRGSALNPAMASGLDNLVGYSLAKLWVHGHVHGSHDYNLGGTRVVCNARGRKISMNEQFRPDLVVEI